MHIERSARFDCQDRTFGDEEAVVDQIGTFGCKSRVFRNEFSSAIDFGVLSVSLQKYGLPDPVRGENNRILDKQRLVLLIRVDSYFYKNIEAVFGPDGNVVEGIPLPSVYIDPVGFAGICQQDGFYLQRFVVPVVNHDLFGGRTDSGKDRVEGEGISGECEAVVRVGRIVFV